MVDDPLTAIDEIKVHSVEGNIIKRNDDTWNFNDIKTSGEGESDFNVDILIDDVNLKTSFDDNEFNVSTPELNLDFDTTSEFSAELKDAKVDGTFEDNQIEISQINTNINFDHSNIKAD